MPESRSSAIAAAVTTFANQVKADHQLGQRIAAGPEDQLKSTVKDLVKAIGAAIGRNVHVLSESPVADVGRPDLAIAVNGLLVGYIELKAPGIGTTPRDFRGTGHNLSQFKKFSALPNLIYTDARDWTFYINGVAQRAFNVRLGEIDETGASELTEDDVQKLLNLFREFLKWEPIVPRKPRELAKELAPLTRMLRTNVEEGANKPDSPLASIYDDWKRTLFPEASAEEFADSYAQTLTYGLLLAKLSGATALDTREAAKAIEHHSSLLSRTLEILTQEGTAEQLGPGLQLLERTIDAVDPAAIRSDGQDPWLYFYEHFLAEYDPKLRNERGVYYTPAEVVKAQVTLVDDLLKTRLGKELGIADRDVTVLDPATGTGTYLLQALHQGIDNAVARLGPGAASSTATQMAENLYGFELLVGPYAVAHLQLNQAVKEAGGHEPEDCVHIYLTDTLEFPNETKPLPHSYFEQPLAEEHRRAREIKKKTPILVCVGNPPYEREENQGNDKGAHTSGGWIRFGDQATPPPLESFIQPAKNAGAGLHLKNLYVYFWRWALWKVFESQSGPGIVSFITASSYLTGPGFVGMREEMRRTFDELWIIDLEDGSRGTRATENVFDIGTSVAIAIGVRYGTPQTASAAMHYARIQGTRSDKLSTLSAISTLNDLDWESTAVELDGTFTAKSQGDYFAWPPIIDLMPWQHSGSQWKRLWPIGESPAILRNRWETLLGSNARRAVFRETRDRQISKAYPDQIGNRGLLPSIASLSEDAPHPEIVLYGYRSFDRQYVLMKVDNLNW